MPQIRRYAAICLLSLPLILAARDETPKYPYQEVMIPVRDGVHLQTVILTPVAADKPLPILIQRTPYGVPDKTPDPFPPSLKELAADGYIFVFQNLRGRFKSEGTFQLSSWVDLNNPKATNEATDAYDTIDWLVKNVPNNNGRVGIFGVSYVGLTAGLTLLHPHPALKAVSEQASPVDQWMNDDTHRYGALRLSYAFEYSVLEQADKNANTHFDFGTYDTYEWYLKLGPDSNVNSKFMHNTLPFWNSVVEHPDYDAFWHREAWVNQLHSAPRPQSECRGILGSGRPMGTLEDLSQFQRTRSEFAEFDGSGPLVPRGVGA